MLKKWMTIGFVLMLAFQPVTSVAAAPAEDGADDAQTEEAQANETDTDNAEADKESEDASEEVEDESSEAEENAVEEDTEDAEATVEEDAEDEADADAEDTEETTEESDEAEAEDEEEVDAQAEDEIETTATADEDLNLNEIRGSASGDITYDIAKGAYVLDLEAGLTNTTNTQDVENKWVVFTLPNDVRPADDLPTGVILTTAGGKSALAVKMPNLQGIGSESIKKQIPLKKFLDESDNNPVVDMFLFNVDTEAETVENLGEINGQREIDFSNMELNPSIDIVNSINGEVEYDAEKKNYFLNLTVDVENNTGSDINGVYAGFEIPEDVKVLDTEDTPDEFKWLRGDEGQAIGTIQLPNVAPGDTTEVTYQIPMIGKTNTVVTADEIPLFTFEGNNYNSVGTSSGNVNVDFSSMDETWDFTVKNEVITDYPGVNSEQKGFRFNYSVLNLTTEDVDAVSMEFIVPDGITIEKPQYIGGDYIEWDGNVATVDLDSVRGGYTHDGYFTAVGTTALTIDQLTDVKVKVTLYRDGETEEKVINAAFVEGKYDEDDFEDTPTDPGNGDDEGNGDAPTPPGNEDDDDGDDGDNGNNNNNGDGNNDDGNSTPGNTDNNNDDGDNDDDGDVSVEVEDGDDSVADGDASVEDGDDDNTLPNTATNMYSMLAAGFVMLALGGVFVAIRRRMA